MEKEQLKNFCTELNSFKQKKIIKDIYFCKCIKIKELNIEMGYPIITLRVGSNTFWSVIISDKPKLHGKSIMISSFLKKIPSKQMENNQKKSQKCFLVYFDNDINDDEKKYLYFTITTQILLMSIVPQSIICLHQKNFSNS